MTEELLPSKNQVSERIEVIRRTVADCMKHSVNNACTWGHEADIQFLLEQYDRLNAQWEKAARLLNEFRPVTGTDEWVAVRVGALNYVLMTASPTPAVGPLVAAPESRDG